MNFDGPFRAVKEPMQPTFAPDSFLPNNKMSCESLTNARQGLDPQITTVDNSWRETARSDYLYHNKQGMCGLKAAQIHERPFRAAKDHVQPLAALDSFLPNGKKILI